MTMRKLIIFFAAALMTVACSDPNQKLVYEGIALGLPLSDYVVETAAGTLKVDVISNTEYSISFVKPQEGCGETLVKFPRLYVKFRLNEKSAPSARGRRR